MRTSYFENMWGGEREREKKKKGNAWWTNKIKDAVEQKKRTCRKIAAEKFA